MDSEKDLLKKELPTLNTPESVESFIKDVEDIGGNEDIVALAKEKLASLQSKVQQIEENPKSQTEGIENLGGNPADLAEKTKEVDSKIEEVKAEASKQIEEVQKDASSEEITAPQAVNITQQEGFEQPSFLTEKGKQEKFDALESEFLKFYTEEPKQEYSFNKLNADLNIVLYKPAEATKILEGLPSGIIEQLKDGQKNPLAAATINEWKKTVGGQIGKLSNERVNIYNKQKEVVGTMASQPEEYLATVSNAARFVPREISEKFVKDAVENFTSEERRNTSGARFLIANEQSRKQRDNIIRNLFESGYNTEVKSFLSSELKSKQMVPQEIFKLSKNGFLTKEEVKDILDSSGYLEEPKQEENSKWG